MKNVLVSIVIPAYNEERYIGKSLESLLSQTYKNVEIIVVDDSSGDKTVEIANKFKVIVLSQEHKGAGAARNLGAKKAKGEILIFPDADMRYNSDYVNKLISPIIKKEAVGTFNKERVANSDNIWARCWSINSDFYSGEREPKNLPNKLPIFRAILKSEFDRAGGFDESVGYTDDNSLSKKLKALALLAPGAIAYHFNPESLFEVFYSARWIGRGTAFSPNLINFLRFSPLNSVRIAIRKMMKGAPMKFLIFKLAYDAGSFMGIFLSFGKTAK